MKKSAVLFVLLFSAILSSSAQNNGGFENWTTVGNIQEPDNWQTMNILSLTSPPNPLSAFKVSGVDKHSGNYALKLTTIYINNNPYPQSIPDTVGNVFKGKIFISPPSLQLGTPYTNRPEKLEFWCKYIPIGNDFGGVFVTLEKWNGTQHDTIAFGDVKIDSTLSYTYFQVTLNYKSAEIPDSIIIGLASSYKQARARVGSILYIDDMALTGSVGVEEQNSYNDKIKVFPNPARDKVTILAQINGADNVEILDASGRLKGNYKIQNFNADVNTSLFPEGVYFYSIRDRKNTILTAGKFNVIK